MTSFSGFLKSVREELPEETLARWSSLFFALSVLAVEISLAVSQAFLALAVLACAIYLLRHKPPLHFPPVKLPLALFSLLTLVSVFWAAYPTVGWLAVRKLVLFLIWLLGANLVISRATLKLIFKGLFLESALAGLVAVGQFSAQYRTVRALHPDRVYFYMTLERIHGFQGHWMNFGGQQMLVFAALLSWLLLGSVGEANSRANHAGLGAGGAPGVVDEEYADPRRGTREHRSRTAWWVVFAMIAISIVLNLSRGVWLGCFAAAVYVVARWKAKWLWALSALLVVSLLVAPKLVRQRVKAMLHPSSDPALSIRFEMWQVGLRMIQEHPLVGVGPDNIDLVYTLYLPPGRVPEVGYHEHLHNNFLQLGAERGLPCLAAWIWLMLALGWNFGKLCNRLGRERWVAEGSLAAWMAFLIEGCFEYNFGTSPVLMLFLFVTSTPFVRAVRRSPSSDQRRVTSDEQ